MMRKKIIIVLMIALCCTMFLKSKIQEGSVDLERYLVPTQRIDSDNPAIIEKTRELLKGNINESEKARILYEFVRDMKESKEKSCGDVLSASNVLNCGINLCYGRSVLLSALCRASGIPSRLYIQRVTLKRGNNSGDITFAHILTGIFINGSWKLYEPVGNQEKWRQWTGDDSEESNIKVSFSADKDCLFISTDKVILETLPMHFDGFDQSLIEEIKKIDGGVYLK